MIKLVYVIHRRSDVPEAAFYEYWLNKHGPLVRSHAKKLRAKKYVQSHLIDTPHNEVLRSTRGMLPPVAGITEVWWDSLEDFEAAYASAEGRVAHGELAADEEIFIDITKSQVFLTQEHMIFDYTDKKPLGEQSMKVTYLLTKRNDLTQAACHETWLDPHGPLVRSFADVSNMAKYVQSHAMATEINAGMMTERGFAAPLDGITEVWIADPAASQGGDEARKASEALINDERRFVDMSKSCCFMTKEHVIFDYT
ncbi:uncharacterized protein HMPREF1541_05675 [Cyphellophora europaea CBS 101466]|uniref:EthD domain-containing protein n=1 Tax=Cyphellophora europaea (strain CBS 101466) TaxID=1220924 RepID=W2RSP0_CYPE1|nr:uncharacterized protein HMPREF1541_05675 [Cyphellophora europaea CBS 101466]ETN39452.1 hypothetical protein HMPREF1541_05675 [Cyphellophora europaea CBS 101466]